MICLLKKILGLLTVKQKNRYYYLQFLVVIAALSEVVSVLAIGPFMALVGNIELINNNKLVNNVYLYLEFSSEFGFLFFVGFSIFFLLCFSALVSIVTIRRLSMFAAEVGAEFGDTLYSYYLNKNYLYHVGNNSSVLIKQIATEVNRITDNIFQPLVQINARVVTVLFISLSIFIYDPVVSVVGFFVIFCCYCFLFYFVRDKLAENGNKITKASKKKI